MSNRICTITIIVMDREQASKINQLLSEFGDKIIGRLGIPYKEKDISIISVIIESTSDDIGRITGKLGQMQGIKVKSLTV